LSSQGCFFLSLLLRCGICCLFSFALFLGSLLLQYLLLFLQHHFESFLVKFGVPLDHKLFEGNEIFNCHDLRNNFRMLWFSLGFIAGFKELFLSYI
jgi:hypothetical protein